MTDLAIASNESVDDDDFDLDNQNNYKKLLLSPKQKNESKQQVENSDTKKVSLSRFGVSFQENLVRMLIIDRAYCNQMMEVIDINFLELEHLKHITKRLFSYKNKYKIHPTLEIVKTLCTTKIADLDSVIKEQVVNFLNSFDFTTTILDSEYIKSTSIDFCRTQKVKEAIIESLIPLENANFDAVYSLFDKALKAGLDQSHGHEYLEDFEERYEGSRRVAIETGWPIINAETSGGLGRGELAVFIAPTGCGKSMRLVHAGAEALRQGKTVVFYTLELKDSTIGKRFDACLSGIKINDLWDMRGTVEGVVKSVPGRLIIKEYPMRSASPKTIENHIEKLKMRDIHPDLVIIDYGDLLRPTDASRDGNSVTDGRTVYEELRSLMQRFDIAGLTASQSNRAGLNVDVLTLEYIADAFAKCMIADFIITFSSKGKAFVAKNRNGDSGMVYNEIADFSIVKTDLINHVDEETVETEIKNSAKELANRNPDLSDKIHLFLKNTKGHK